MDGTTVFTRMITQKRLPPRGLTSFPSFDIQPFTRKWPKIYFRHIRVNGKFILCHFLFPTCLADMSNTDDITYTFTVGSSKLSATGVTFYELTYSTTNSENCKTNTETIWRRYSEVRDLYKILLKRFSCVKLSPLPKGSYLDRFKTEVSCGFHT